MRAGQPRQVWPVPDAADEGRGRRPLAFCDVDVKSGAAVLIRPVIILHHAVACLVYSLEKGLFHGVMAGHSADRDRTGIAAATVAAAE